MPNAIAKGCARRHTPQLGLSPSCSSCSLPEWNYGTEQYSLPVETPPWSSITEPTEALQALWIGHVTFLLQTRAAAPAGGQEQKYYNVLTDPVFSDRASPVSFAGPKRYTPPACAVAELSPPVHAVLISHNHYDHLDTRSVYQLLEKEQRDLSVAADARSGPFASYKGTRWFVPLGVSHLLEGMGVAKGKITEMDWWQAADIDSGSIVPSIESTPPASALPSSPSGRSSGPTVTCVPAQHQSARYGWDRNASLWCGYVMNTQGGPRWYFSGDTGYRAVPHGAAPGSVQEESSPACPAFREIGERLGPFDLSLLPIGAYSPRFFMSSFHASPEDAVCMHVDVRSKRSVGMHWGAFPLTDEPIEEPVQRLQTALKRKGLTQQEFVAVKHGQVYSPTYPGGVLPAAASSTRDAGAGSRPHEEASKIQGARREEGGGALMS